MALRDIIVVGASAGGVGALRAFVGGLPRNLDASVFVVQHLAPWGQSALPEILSRSGFLPAVTPVDGDAIEPNKIYVAPPDFHMLLHPGKILVRRGPQENRTRPAIDPLFRSAAIAYGSRVIGVVLTGMLDDGTNGLIAIKAAGGISVVQDPDEAEWPSMPLTALEHDSVDYCLPVAEMPSLLFRLCREPAGLTRELPKIIVDEAKISEREFAVPNEVIPPPGEASPLSCPECGGVLNQLGEGPSRRFRCQVGHAFTPDALAAAQSDELERAIGIAVRTHRDRMKLFQTMREEAESHQHPHAAGRWRRASEEAAHMVDILEKAMTNLRKPITALDEPGSA